MPSKKRANNRQGPARPAPAGRQQATRGVDGRKDPEYARQQAERRGQRRILIAVVAGLVLLLAVGVGGVQLWRNYRSPSAPEAQQPSAAAATPKKGKPITFGRTHAPVTLRLYEDFRCPHCQDFESAVGDKISQLVRSGQLRVKTYPLTFVEPDGASRDTANAYGCAAAAGFGPAYRAGLFDNKKLAWTDDQLVKLGRSINAGKAKSSGFSGCVRDGKQRGWLKSIATAASQQKVDKTPTVFINGHRKSGAAEWDGSKLEDEVQAAK